MLSALRWRRDSGQSSPRYFVASTKSFQGRIWDLMRGLQILYGFRAASSTSSMEGYDISRKVLKIGTSISMGYICPFLRDIIL